MVSCGPTWSGYKDYTLTRAPEPWDAPLQEQYSQYQLPLGEKSVYTTFDRSVADPAWHSISMKDGCECIHSFPFPANTTRIVFHQTLT